MIEQAVGFFSSLLTGAMKDQIKSLAKEKFNEKALDKLCRELDEMVEKRFPDPVEREALRDSVGQLAYTCTKYHVLPKELRDEWTRQFYAQNPSLIPSEKTEELLAECYNKLDRYLVSQFGLKDRLAMLTVRRDGKRNTSTLPKQIDQTEDNIKNLLKSGRGIPMLCVCRERPVQYAEWNSESDGIDLFSADTLFFTEDVGENTRKLTLALANPGQAPVTSLALSDFMVGVVTDVQYERNYFDSAQIYQGTEEQVVKNIIFPGQRFDLSIVFDDELDEEENPGYLYISFALSALCADSVGAVCYHYDLFCDRLDKPDASDVPYTGTYCVCVLRQS